MDRGHLQNSDLNRSHEPVGIPLNRPPGTFSPTVGEGRDEGVRFMESLLSLLRTHWDHEPLRLTEARSGPRVCDPQPARFVENTVSACKKSRPMAGFLLQSTCREFRESDRTNKFYRPRSPPRPRPRIPHFRLRERGRRRQVRPIPVDRRCSSLQPKPVAAHLLTFPLSPLQPRQARRTVLLWLQLRGSLNREPRQTREKEKNTLSNHRWTRMNTDIPHPASGHPLPRRGRGKGEGAASAGQKKSRPMAGCLFAEHLS